MELLHIYTNINEIRVFTHNFSLTHCSVGTLWPAQTSREQLCSLKQDRLQWAWICFLLLPQYMCLSSVIPCPSHPHVWGNTEIAQGLLSPPEACVWDG